MNLKMNALEFDSDDDDLISESFFLDVPRDHCQDDNDETTISDDAVDVPTLHQVDAPSQIEQHKTEIAELKAEVARLNIRVTELEKKSQPASGDTDEGEKSLKNLTEPAQTSKQSVCDHTLVMRIAVLVGGEDGTDVELALVKMNSDTPFETVLENLRQQHPLKALKQKSTGEYIFDSDTPTSLGFKDGEELVFIQQSDEPMFMLDATMNDAKCWRGKDSRISWEECGV